MTSLKCVLFAIESEIPSYSSATSGFCFFKAFPESRYWSFLFKSNKIWGYLMCESLHTDSCHYLENRRLSHWRHSHTCNYRPFLQCLWLKRQQPEVFSVSCRVSIAFLWVTSGEKGEMCKGHTTQWWTTFCREGRGGLPAAWFLYFFLLLVSWEKKYTKFRTPYSYSFLFLCSEWKLPGKLGYTHYSSAVGNHHSLQIKTL